MPVQEIVRFPRRVLDEIRTVNSLCGRRTALRFTGNIVARLPAIVRRRNLQPADRAVGDDLTVRYNDVLIALNPNTLDEINTVTDDSPSFSGVRELFGRSVYTRGFKSLPKTDTMLDLGANRGLVSLFGAKCLGAKWVCGVEPTQVYADMFKKIASDNDLTPEQSHRIVALCGTQAQKDVVTVDDVLAQHKISELGFLKCDIEGGEQAVFLEGSTAFLAKTQRLALELHPHFGVDCTAIKERLVNEGFTCSWTDAAGGPVEIAKADYLYGSRDQNEIR